MATAATPTSSPEGGRPDGLVTRFGASERALHWVHAAGFTGMVASGLVLYLPALSASVGSRPTIKAVHLGVAAAWLTALALVWVAGDRRELRRTRHELETYFDDDVRWLRGRKAPQGRFNAGQKSHAVVQAALAALFVLSGALLWLGERSAPFRLPGTVALHDAAMFLALALVAGHLFLALIWPATRPALRGIVRGTVDAEWARRHHAAWRPSREPEAPRPPLGARRLTAGGALVLVGIIAVVLLVRGSLGSEGPTAAPAAAAAAPAAQPALKPGADTLSIEADQALQSGQYAQAVGLLRQAVRQAPRRVALRTTLGYALAQSGDQAGAERELRGAVALDRRSANAHLFLGAVLASAAGTRAEGHTELRTYLRLAPGGTYAASAKSLLAQTG